jgi:hypothetical protein
MHSPCPFVVAALLALAGGVADTARAAPDCPRQDQPGPLTDFAPGRATTTIHVVDGVAVVHYRLTLHNTSNGPAHGLVTLQTRRGVDDIGGHDDAIGSPLIVQHAHLVGSAASGLEDAFNASQRFSAFRDALQDGVEPEDAVVGGHRAALLVAEDSEGDVTVEVAAACSVRTVTVEVDGAVLSTPRQGGWRFLVPRLSSRDDVIVTADDAEVWVDGTTPALNGRVTVSGPARPLDGEEDFGGAPFVVDARPTVGRLRAAGVLRTFKATAGKTSAAKTETPSDLMASGFSLLQASVDLPSPLTTTAADMRLVFVVDSSVSAGDDGVKRTLTLVNHILDAAPDDARWALVTASRNPRLVVAPWRARDDRFLPEIVVENGSNLSAAVALAARIGGDAGAGSGRVIVLSDLQLGDVGAPRLVGALHASPVGAQAPVVHVLELPADLGVDEELGFVRELAEDVPLVSATARHGGLFLGVSPGGEDGDELALARFVIRPTRLDRMQLFVDGVDVSNDVGVDPMHAGRALGWDAAGPSGDGTLPRFLLEGGGLRLAQTMPVGSRRVQFRGLLWAEPVVIDLEAAPTAAALGTAINGVLRAHFSGADDAVTAVATAGHFVSRMTSLAAVPAFRPARPDGFGTQSWSWSCGCGGCGGSGSRSTHCSIGHASQPPKLAEQALLDALAQTIADHCLGDVDVTLEIGDLEILEVTAKNSARHRARCIAEGFWHARLDRLTPGDGSFEKHGHRTAMATWTPPKPAEAPAEPNGTDQVQ